MRLGAPRTLLGLIFSGLALIALPLLLAIGIAAYRLGQLTTDSLEALNTGARATVLTRQIDGLLINMERNARQSLVLGATRSGTALDLYREDAELILLSVNDLAVLPQADTARQQIVLIRSQVEQLNRLLSEPPENSTETAVISVFEQLDAAARELEAAARANSEALVLAVQADSEQAQRLLGLQAAALLPLTMVLGGFFLLRVIRPMRQLDRTIRDLGAGNVSRRIELNGPADLIILAERLEWLRNKLEESARAKDKFLRHMSHELKTPLANIREGAELLMDGAIGELDDSQHEIVDIVRTNSLRLQLLIENLLTYSEWQSTAAVLEKSDFELQPLVTELADQYQLTLTKHAVRLDLAVSADHVFTDRNKLRLILDNLLSNAVKFSPPGGAISLTVRVDRHMLDIRLRDSGPGIDSADRDRIFDAFYQGKQPQGGYVGGTGIGLSIVRECVDAFRGEIMLDASPGEGTCFHVKLPLSGGPQQLPLERHG